jgi:hypothetical protein
LILPLVNIANATLPTLSPHPNITFVRSGNVGPPPQNLNEADQILVNNSLQFLNNVANINISSYNVNVRVANEALGVAFGKTVHFNLSSAKGIIDATALFTNGKLFWSSIFSVKGTLVLNQPVSPNALTSARDTLSKLQAFSARDYLLTFQSMLNSVTELQDSKTSNSNYTQQITVSGNIVTLSWEPSINGLSAQQNNFCLEFRNGNLEYYFDWLGIHAIGSSDVKISEAQAIQIANDRARTFSYVQDSKDVSNFTVLTSFVTANVSLDNRGNNTLYPLWTVMLPLDKEYPGGVTAFQALIWADTGEVARFTPIGFYGDPNAVPSSDPQETTSPTGQAASENNQPAVSYSVIIGTALVAAAINHCELSILKEKKIDTLFPSFCSALQNSGFFASGCTMDK